MLVSIKDTDDLNIYKYIGGVLYAPSTSKNRYKFFMIYLSNAMASSSIKTINSKLF